MTIKELFAPSDMTVGKPWEKIVIFTIPMLIGNIAQQLYNTVDSIVIGTAAIRPAQWLSVWTKSIRAKPVWAESIPTARHISHQPE